MDDCRLTRRLRGLLDDLAEDIGLGEPLGAHVQRCSEYARGTDDEHRETNRESRNHVALLPGIQTHHLAQMPQHTHTDGPHAIRSPVPSPTHAAAVCLTPRTR